MELRQRVALITVFTSHEANAIHCKAHCLDSDLAGEMISSAQSRPEDWATSELHAHPVAGVRQPLAVNHVPASRRFFVHGSHYHPVPELPGMSRKYTSAVRADVICVGPLFSLATRTLCPREAYCDDDGEASFHSATDRVVHRHVSRALTGHPRRVAAR
jgi:hypothetical protein